METRTIDLNELSPVWSEGLYALVLTNGTTILASKVRGLPFPGMVNTIGAVTFDDHGETRYPVNEIARVEVTIK